MRLLHFRETFYIVIMKCGYHDNAGYQCFMVYHGNQNIFLSFYSIPHPLLYV